MGSSTENSAFGPVEEPARPDQGAGRLVRRQRGGRGGRLRAARPRVRHRRLDPPARRAVRRGRHEAHLRAGEPLRAGRLRVEPRPDRPVRRHGRRRRRPVRGDRRPRPGRLDVDPRGGAVGARPPRRRRRRAARRRREGAARHRGHRPRRRRPRRGRRRGARGGRRQGRGGVGARGDLRPVRLLPDRARRGVEQPGSLRRRPLRPPGRRAHHRRDVRPHPHGRLRRRGRAAHHARHLRPVGGLLRRLLRQGPEGPHADHPRLPGRLRALRRAAVTDVAHHRLRARRQGRPAGHVPQRRVHDPVEPGRAPRGVGARSAWATTACPSASR